MIKRHALTVQPYKQAPGSSGQAEWVVDGDPVQVRGNVHPLDADEIQFFGERARDMRKVFYYGRTWPGDIHCRIEFDGVEWDQAEPERHFDLGYRTQHFEVMIRRR